MRVKGFILRSLERAGYAIVHVEALRRERRAAEENLEHLREARAEAARLKSELASLRMVTDGANAAESLESTHGAPPMPDPGPSRRESVLPTPAVAIDQTDDQPKSGVRPLEKILADEYFIERPSMDGEWIAQVVSSEPYRKIVSEYFQIYPAHSCMPAHSRAMLYWLIRTIKPEAVAEIGTLFAGTTEVMARALWENGRGIILTTDPYGADRVPAAIARWPKPLRDRTRFHADNSMSFFLRLQEARIRLDLILVDGNHDFEFARFDLSMAAQLMRPGGVIVMDNGDQSGPFFASWQFLAHNPGWREVGDVIARFDRSRPFDPARSCVPGTSFLILQAPESYLVQAVPRSGGNQNISASRIDGFAVDLAPQSRRGVLRFQVFLRAFRDEHRQVEEYRRIGGLPVDADGAARRIEHRFEHPLVSLLQERKGDCDHTLEIELAWEGSTDRSALQLTRPPEPLFAS